MAHIGNLKGIPFIRNMPRNYWNLGMFIAAFVQMRFVSTICIEIQLLLTALSRICFASVVFKQLLTICLPS